MEKFLDYGDSLLRRQDVDLLRGPFWLNDQIIGFYFEYLAMEAFKQPGLLLVSGSSSFLAANLGPEASAAVLEPLGFASAQLTLFAVNNNPDVEQAEGGSHWSLLAYSAADNTFHHFDSASGSNRSAASRVFDAARRPGSILVQQPTPQQHNGYDCGVYVLALARLLCQRHAEHGQGMRFEVTDKEVSPASINALRRQVLELICAKASNSGTGS